MAGAMLSSTDVQEELSLAYVRAVACHAGFSVEGVTKDRDGIDLHIHARDLIVPEAALSSPVLAVQLKAHGVENAPEEPTFPFDVPVKNYNKLCVPRSAIPRVLVVYLMPKQPAEWLNWSEEKLVMRRSAYWHSLRGKPPSTNQEKHRIQIDRANVFNPQSVRALLERVAKEEDL